MDQDPILDLSAEQILAAAVSIAFDVGRKDGLGLWRHDPPRRG